MPIDANGWRAGIANTKHCYFLHVKQRNNDTFSDYSFSILRIFLYLYLFIISSLATGQLSVCATVILIVFRLKKLSLSPWLNKNTLILSYSLLANFASLTVHTKATIYFLLHVIKIGPKKIFARFYKIILSCIMMLVCMFKVYNLYYICIKHTLSGDIHPNPGPFIDSLKFCHWNLSSSCARDKIKIPLIEAYNSVFHYDLIASSETNLNATVHNEKILIEGFSKEIFRNDHPSGDKQGGFCIYLRMFEYMLQSHVSSRGFPSTL